MKISDINSWPSFLWYFLSDSSHRQIYGKKLWSIFSLKWIEWRLESISQFDEFNEVSLVSPNIVVKDITNEKVEFDTLASSGKLDDLALACNKHLFPNVLWPWGYNEYIQKSERTFSN